MRCVAGWYDTWEADEGEPKPKEELAGIRQHNDADRSYEFVGYLYDVWSINPESLLLRNNP